MKHKFITSILVLALVWQQTGRADDPGRLGGTPWWLRPPAVSERTKTVLNGTTAEPLLFSLPVKTYDLPEEFGVLAGINPIELWLEAFRKIGLKDKVIISVKGSLVQSSVEESGRPYWPAVGDIDLQFYIDSDSPQAAGYEACGALKAILIEKNIPWEEVSSFNPDPEAWNGWEMLRTIQLGKQGRVIWFDAAPRHLSYSYNSLLEKLPSSYSEVFLGPFYQYYGDAHMVQKTNDLFRQQWSREDCLKLLYEKYKIWVAITINLDIQSLSRNNRHSKVLKFLAYLAELRGLTPIKKEILQKAVAYEEELSSVAGEQEFPAIFRSLMSDVEQYARVLIPPDEDGAIFYNSLNNIRELRGIFKSENSQVSWKTVRREMRRHYLPILRRAGLKTSAEISVLKITNTVMHGIVRVMGVFKTAAYRSEIERQI